MKRKNLLVLILLLSNAFGQLSAQELGKVTGSKIRQVPAAYKFPDNEIGSSKVSQAYTGPYSQWVVFSDRPDNQTYKESKGLAPFKKMNFMDAFYVINEKGPFLRIVKFNPYLSDVMDPKTNKIKIELEDFGWVAKDKLLLWKSALVEDKTNFTIKALLINPTGDFKTPANTPKLYSGPDLKTENKNNVHLADFFYIYKKEGDAVLVGNSTEINNPAFVDKQVLGWVSKNTVQEWNSRIALEPNRDAEAVNERRAGNMSTALFSTPEDALSYKISGKTESKNVVWNNDSYDALGKPGYAKFPVLQKQDNGLVKLGMMSDVYDLTGGKQIKQEEQFDIENKYNLQTAKSRNVNLVFVIDGSEWMKEYFPVVSKAITSCADYVNERNYDNPKAYRVGSVIYRDYSERDCAEGDILFEALPLKNNFYEAANFLKDVSKARNCRDRDKSQAVFFGISEALKMFEGHKNETNIIILIGSAGNSEREQYIKKQDLINDLAKSTCSLFAFRVKSQSDDVYFDFLSQSKDLMIESAKQIQAGYQKYFPGKISVKLESKYRLDYPKTSPLPGAIVYADADKPMPPDTLVKKIVSIIDELNTQQKIIQSNTASVVKRQGENIVFNEGTYLFLSRMEIPSFMMQKSTSAHMQSFVPAYTYTDVSTLKKPLFKNTILVSERELSDLIVQFKHVTAIDVSRNDLRNDMPDVLKTIAKVKLGYDRSEKVINNISSDAWYRYCTTHKPFKSSLLGDIGNKGYSVFITNDKTELLEILKSIKEKIPVLEKIQSDKQNFFLLNDQRFCWVSEDYLP